MDELEGILWASDYNDNFAFSGVYDFDPEMIYDASDFLPFVEGVAKAIGAEGGLCNMSGHFLGDNSYWNSILVYYQFDGANNYTDNIAKAERFSESFLVIRGGLGWLG